MTPPPLLDRLLQIVTRRYRLPDLTALATNVASPAVAVAVAIERARLSIGPDGAPPPSEVRQAFLGALAQLVRQALREDGGDPVFQAMMLRHRVAAVREYASLSTHAEQDRRQLRGAVNAIAHPGRRARTADADQRAALERLHAAATEGDWHALESTARQLRALPGVAADGDGGGSAPLIASLIDPLIDPLIAPLIAPGIDKLLAHPALARMQRLDALASHPRVAAYRALWSRHGPEAGTVTATSAGVASRERGAAAEAAAARALAVMADRLNADARYRAADVPGTASPYRIVTSMRVPSTIPASHDRAKSEWDVVLLRQRPGGGDTHDYDICLLLEVKASVEAATTDFPRLLRGLRLLGHADPDKRYAFDTNEGTVSLHGGSLHAFGMRGADRQKDPERDGHRDESGVAAFLYCCDVPADATPRVLGAASRMQLLSAAASLHYASALAEGADPEVSMLAPVWDQLLTSPRWATVLHQYPMLREVRERMVHTADLLAVAASA
ncbi:3-deoxy-D-arabino-heptulosonate 7-phosphate synthase [Cupriavidus plantarum]|uniref:3-deoxy-D-arabino-heptulosonate 7-phosphate synthase n=1 Tax=Cupriavidus plantarum TaxID=942865 RepID=UPI001ABF8037|nr:3-deoxy-D-arabino-heptulosonate 7-phosphate synthase [Cupriavidus plantarum]